MGGDDTVFRIFDIPPEGVPPDGLDHVISIPVSDPPVTTPRELVKVLREGLAAAGLPTREDEPPLSPAPLDTTTNSCVALLTSRVHCSRCGKAEVVHCFCKVGSQADRMFLRLHSMLPTLLHRNLATYYHVATFNNFVLSCSKWEPLGSVRALVKRHGRLTERLAGCWFLQVTDGLYFLHASGVAHRNLHAGNVLITREHNVKICDLEHAKELAMPRSASGDGSEAEPTSDIPGPGMDSWSHSVVCAIDIVPPEVLLNRDHAHQPVLADTWALGLFLYTMLYGKSPFSTLKLDGSTLDPAKIDFPLRVAAPVARATPEVAAPPAQTLSLGIVELMRKRLLVASDERANVYQVTRHPWYRHFYLNKVPKRIHIQREMGFHPQWKWKTSEQLD